MKRSHRITCCGVLLLACAAWAQDPHHAGHANPAPASAPTQAEGEVIKADPANKKVTLRHGEIKSLNMAPMTMDFSVADEALFARLKPGSKIRFTARKINGAYTVLTVEAAQ
jgi:Cu/Ag efflux protein CusF